MAEMYCVKCRAKRDDPNAEKVTMKNGKPALKGKCPVCGTGMYKIGAAQSLKTSWRPIWTSSRAR